MHHDTPHTIPLHSLFAHETEYFDEPRLRAHEECHPEGGWDSRSGSQIVKRLSEYTSSTFGLTIKTAVRLSLPEVPASQGKYGDTDHGYMFWRARMELSGLLLASLLFEVLVMIQLSLLVGWRS
jgi:hypothetical protein